jgi:DNA-directed RNA polymerase subunit RPC12/RpoP
MLIKKELSTIPIQPAPKLKGKSQAEVYVAAASVAELPKSGKILAVDIYTKKDRSLVVRFFADGKNYTTFHSAQEAWGKSLSQTLGNPYYVDDSRITASKEDLDLAYEMLKDKITFQWERDRMRDMLDAYCLNIHREKAQRAYNRKMDLQKQHFEMFPAYPKGLVKYCEEHVFATKYAFVGKKEKRGYPVVCTICRRKFFADHPRHKKYGTCPRCGSRVKFFLARYQSSIEEKVKVCIAGRVDGCLLLRWVTVTRTFDNNKPKHNFCDYYRTLYIRSKKGTPTIYSYEYKNVMYWGEDWYRQSNGTTNHKLAYLYKDNLTEVFGKKYYNIDLEAELADLKEPLDFVGLLNNLQSLPPTEYLVRLGLYRLAQEISADDLGDGRDFSSVLGVSKQYLPMYQEMNIALHEHNIVKASSTWVSPESFLKLRKLNISPWYADEVCALLGTMSFVKFVNYFTKQKALYPKEGTHQLLTWYRDYIEISESLGVDLSRKSTRFPAEIRAAHDRIVAANNEFLLEKAKENLAIAQEILDTGQICFQSDKFTIMMPTCRQDFIREGQSLSHCVGNEAYFNRHITGESMIFFIRRNEDVDKPFVTLEINMRHLHISKIYGFGDKRPPAEVLKFADAFLKELKRNNGGKAREAS